MLKLAFETLTAYNNPSSLLFVFFGEHDERMALSAPLRVMMSLSEFPELIHRGHEDWSSYVRLPGPPSDHCPEETESKADFEDRFHRRKVSLEQRRVNKLTSLPWRLVRKSLGELVKSPCPQRRQPSRAQGDIHRPAAHSHRTCWKPCKSLPFALDHRSFGARLKG